MADRTWIRQRARDPFLRRAHQEGYRSRAAFKLLEIDRKHHLLKPGALVIDLGCAPGSWTQVAAGAIGERGRVIGIDLLAVDPVPGATLLQGDFTDPAMQARIDDLLGGRPADLVISDMAPHTTGIHHADVDGSLELARAALDFAVARLRPGGHFVAKVFEGPDYRQLLLDARSRFETARSFAPEASLKRSREIFLVARGFRPATGVPGRNPPTS